MNYTKDKIAKESIATLAKHYKVSTQAFAQELANGNQKLTKEVLELCEKTLEALYA